MKNVSSGGVQMNDCLVYVIDDDPGASATVEKILIPQGIKVCTYSCAEQFIGSCVSHDATCLILDLQMPGMTGLALLDWLNAHHVYIPVIVLSGHSDVPAVVDSMKRGAVDFIEKPVNPDALLKKVKAAEATSRDRILNNAKLQQMRDRLARLTEREKELVGLLSEGLSSKQIAMKLGISLKTVENHRSHLLAKMKAVNVASLVRMLVLAGESYI
jgi:FixJ family two-component response regulator